LTEARIYEIAKVETVSHEYSLTLLQRIEKDWSISTALSKINVQTFKNSNFTHPPDPEPETKIG
jgi:hypothetical protein